MGKMDELRQKAEGFEIRKSWQYLVYIVAVLPGVLFGLAWLLRSGGIGVALARMFHTYNLYVSSPVPNLAPFNGTGVLGLIIVAVLAVWAVRRKDWTDLAVTVVLAGINGVYFWMGWNYLLLRFLNLTGSVL